MSGQEGRAPQSLLELEDTGVRYDTYQRRFQGGGGTPLPRPRWMFIGHAEYYSLHSRHGYTPDTSHSDTRHVHVHNHIGVHGRV